MISYKRIKIGLIIFTIILSLILGVIYLKTRSGDDDDDDDDGGDDEPTIVKNNWGEYCDNIKIKCKDDLTCI
jgi:hypothetical protein